MKAHALLRTSRLAAISLAVPALLTLSAGPASADVKPPPVPAVTVGSDLDPATLVDTAKKTACTPQGADDEFATWAGMLTAQVNRNPLRGQVQYVWNTFDSSVGDAGASALAYVPDTGCAQGVKVTSQIVDTTAAPNCNPVVESDEVSSYSNEHWTFDDGTKVLVGLNPNAFLFPVTYYGDDGSEVGSGSRIQEELPPASTPDEYSPLCVRYTSTVTVETNGYYKNNLGDFVWFACGMDEYQIVASPIEPNINYIQTVPC